MTTAVVLRSFLTVHIVLGPLLVAVFNIANLLRYWAIDWLVDLLRPWLDDQTRLSLPVDPLPSVNPWLFVLAIAVVTSFLPLSIAYWLPSASRPESYERTRLVAFIICSATGFVMSLEAGAYVAAISVARDNHGRIRVGGGGVGERRAEVTCRNGRSRRSRDGAQPIHQVARDRHCRRHDPPRHLDSR